MELTQISDVEDRIIKTLSKGYKQRVGIAQALLGSPDVIILDPPRAGCDEKLVDFASSLSPKRIVYISCNPATLARDVKRFNQNGYFCDTVWGFDLFPLTGHVESVVCLEKQTK